MRSFELYTSGRDSMTDITKQIREAIRESGVDEGYAIVYCPHTTAGIAINENADPDVVRRLDEVFPWHHKEDRHAEGNTAAHLKAMYTGTSQTVLIQDGKPILGTWQGIYFCEFDGPRTRRVMVKVVAG